jgi:hypothetical protein
MYRRRKPVIALGAGALAAPFFSFARQQRKVWRVGIFGEPRQTGFVSRVDAFKADVRPEYA